MNFVFSVCIRLGYYYDMEEEHQESYQEYLKYKKREREEYEDMKEIYISIARMFNA